MSKFTYIATTNSGKSVNGEMDASSRDEVINRLIKQKLKPVSIKELKNSKFDLNNLMGGSNVKPDELVIFTRQLSAMISAGVPLLRSLDSLSEHAKNPAFKKIIRSISANIEEGENFGDALEKHPLVFSDVYVNMVRAGEAAGILDDILKRLALQQEKSATIRKKVKSAMSYPIVLMVITVLAFFGLMLFVIPQIGKIIKDLGGEDAELPMLTQIMLGISDALIAYWFIILPIFGGVVFGLLRFLRTPAGKKIFHKVILKTPAISGIIKKVAVARFARTYASLVGAGVAVLEGLDVTSKAIGNTVYQDVLASAAVRVQEGEQLSKIIEEHEDLFPSILSQMLSVGEETGQTDTVLLKVADFYEEEVDVAIDGISSIIEPIMILVMGSMVGLIAASVMGPIASISQNIK